MVSNFFAQKKYFFFSLTTNYWSVPKYFFLFLLLEIYLTNIWLIDIQSAWFRNRVSENVFISPSLCLFFFVHSSHFLDKISDLKKNLITISDSLRHVLFALTGGWVQGILQNLPILLLLIKAISATNSTRHLFADTMHREWSRPIILDFILPNETEIGQIISVNSVCFL